MNPTIRALLSAGIIDQPTAELLERQLDPAVARAWADQELTQAFSSSLSGQQQRMLEFISQHDYAPTAAQMEQFWQSEAQALWHGTSDTLLSVAGERAALEAVGMGLGTPAMWNTINQQVLDWTRNYYLSPTLADVGSVPNLNATTRAQFEQAFSAWNRGELGGRADGLPQLIRSLEPTFGPVRAERIAITETTRIFSQAALESMRANEAITHVRFMTSRDELVCPICAPLNGQVVEKDSAGFPGFGWPPAHPNCRCDIQAESSLTLAIPFVG